MKIYFASQSFYPYIGGVSTYLLNLAKRLVELGNQVVEVHLRPSGETHEEDVKGIKIHRVPREPINSRIMSEYSAFKEIVYRECHENKNLFIDPPDKVRGYEAYNTVNDYFGQQLNELLKIEPADVVHIHDFQLLFAYRYVPRGIPCILTWHIPFNNELSPFLKDFLISQLREYDKVVFSSPEYIEAAVNACLPREKTELIYPIANTEIFRPKKIDKVLVKARYGLSADSEVILCVQRVDPKSGHEQLIKALSLVLKKRPKAKLVFAGGDSLSNKLSADRQRLKDHILRLVEDMHLSRSVIWTGNIDYYQLPDLYNAADVVALCSKNEGFGLAVTEGMACAKAMVGTRVGGIPLQIQDGKNGFLVDVGDIEATARVIASILSDGKMAKKMGAASVRIVERAFTLQKGVEKHLILYGDVIAFKNRFHRLRYLHPDNLKGIITDLDRTITDKPAKHNLDLSDYNMRLLDSLRQLNIDLFLATGRPLEYVKALCEKMPLWRCVIAENGSVLYFTRTKKIIAVDTGAMEKARSILRKNPFPGIIFGKVIISIPRKYELPARQLLSEIIEDVRFITNVDEVMILPIGVDKGAGVRMALQYLAIDIDKTLVIGEGENDIDMFLNPGFKIALANANTQLKKLADEVTSEPSSRGVLSVISQLLARKDRTKE